MQQRSLGSEDELLTKVIPVVSLRELGRRPRRIVVVILVGIEAHRAIGLAVPIFIVLQRMRVAVRNKFAPVVKIDPVRADGSSVKARQYQRQETKQDKDSMHAVLGKGRGRLGIAYPSKFTDAKSALASSTGLISGEVSQPVAPRSAINHKVLKATSSVEPSCMMTAGPVPSPRILAGTSTATTPKLTKTF